MGQNEPAATCDLGNPDVVRGSVRKMVNVPFNQQARCFEDVWEDSRTKVAIREEEQGSGGQLIQ